MLLLGTSLRPVASRLEWLASNGGSRPDGIAAQHMSMSMINLPRLWSLSAALRTYGEVLANAIISKAAGTVQGALADTITGKAAGTVQGAYMVSPRDVLELRMNLLSSNCHARKSCWLALGRTLRRRWLCRQGFHTLVTLPKGLLIRLMHTRRRCLQSASLLLTLLSACCCSISYTLQAHEASACNTRRRAFCSSSSCARTICAVF